MLYSLHYYDLMLIGVIVPLLAGLAIGYASSIPLIVAVPVLGGLSILVMIYALFVNGPVDEVEDLGEEVEELPGPAENFLE